jgi:aminoglycoside phosphotransferase (APT) family kinase protein
LNATHLQERLERYLNDAIQAPCTVHDFAVMADGHAGLTFGFRLSGARAGSYILKVGPPGVPRRGSTDVYRQAPLLRALHAEGLPVPEVPWAEADEAALGVPFIIMERLPGRTFIVWEPHDSFAGADREFVRSLWLQDIAALARLHCVDWRTRLADWESPFTLRAELERWGSILRHALEPTWLDAGQRLGKALAARVPDGEPIGLVHGDFQPGNSLYDDGRLTGIIDWDLAGIGAQGIDVGWLLMTVDPKAWAIGWRPVAPVLGPELVAAYRAAGGPAARDLEWYQAFAQFRLGAIACLNVKLHRDGRRHDPIWERFATSISTLFARGEELMSRRSLDA